MNDGSDRNLYAFSFPPTARLLNKLKSTSTAYVLYPNNLDHFLKLLLLERPTYILGLGSYSGVDQDKIRIETVCTNRFRNVFVDGSQRIAKRALRPFLTEGPHMKFAAALGNSHCNRVCWEIMGLIEKGELQSEYTFLHVPKGMKEEVVVKVLDHTLINSLYT